MFVEIFIVNTTPELPIKLTVLYNNILVEKITTDDNSYKIAFDIDSISTHNVKLIVSEKTDNHTIVDSSGNIIKSTQIIISRIKLNNVDITELLNNKDVVTYTHNTNGYSNEQIDNNFNGNMSFNGVTELKFKTPLYTWILQYI